MEDLNAAELDDVYEWFKTYYGPNNATIVIAGDIDVATAKEKVQKYFGDIAPGPPIGKQEVWIAKRSGEHRMTIEDRVPQGRVYNVWNVPELGNIELTYLGPRNRRVGWREVFPPVQAPCVRRSNCYGCVFLLQWAVELGSQVVVHATAKPGVDLANIEATLKEELHRLLKDGIEEKETEAGSRPSISPASSAVLSESVGSEESRISLHKTRSTTRLLITIKPASTRFKMLTTDDLHMAAKKWLSDGVFVLEVHPYPELMASGEGADRSSLPEVTSPPDAVFPAVEKTTLKNGLTVLLSQRDAVPVVKLPYDVLTPDMHRIQFASPGTANLAMSMMGRRDQDPLRVGDQ